MAKKLNKNTLFGKLAEIELAFQPQPFSVDGFHFILDDESNKPLVDYGTEAEAFRKLKQVDGLEYWSNDFMEVVENGEQ